MIEHFEKHANVLRRIGNFRIAYAIFIDRALLGKPAGTPLASTELNNLCEQCMLPRGIKCTSYDIAVAADYDNVLRDITDGQNIHLIVGDMSTMPAEYALIFNEVHVAKTGDLNDVCKSLFIECATDFDTNERRVFMRRSITDGELVSFKATRGLQFGSIRLEPYHVVMLHKPSKLALAVIWDSREIVEILECTDEQVSDVLSMVHANDNGHLLYIYSELAEAKKQCMPALSQYIASHVKQY